MRIDQVHALTKRVRALERQATSDGTAALLALGVRKAIDTLLGDADQAEHRDRILRWLFPPNPNTPSIVGLHPTDPRRVKIVPLSHVTPARAVEYVEQQSPVRASQIADAVEDALVEPGAWEERRYEDLELHARMRTVNTAMVEYEVRVLVVHDDGNVPLLKFAWAEGPRRGLGGSDLDNAKLLVTGSIKFDGSSHNNFGDEHGYVHGHSRQELTRLGALYERLFDWTLERMPSNARFLK
ncbi:MAG: hypothetical protein ACHREM_06545 [Polyangiales bacterium]